MTVREVLINEGLFLPGKYKRDDILFRAKIIGDKIFKGELKKVFDESIDNSMFNTHPILKSFFVKFAAYCRGGDDPDIIIQKPEDYPPELIYKLKDLKENHPEEYAVLKAKIRQNQIVVNSVASKRMGLQGTVLTLIHELVHASQHKSKEVTDLEESILKIFKETWDYKSFGDFDLSLLLIGHHAPEGYIHKREILPYFINAKQHFNYLKPKGIKQIISTMKKSKLINVHDSYHFWESKFRDWENS